MEQHIQEDPFTSDEEFEDEEESESDSDIDQRLAEEEVFDEEFLKCYAALKSKDEKIYDENTRFFAERETPLSTVAASSSNTQEKLLEPDYMKSEKPRMTLIDHQLSLARPDVDDEPLETAKDRPSQSHYEKELQSIKESIVKVGHSLSDEESDDEFLISKQRDKVDTKSTKVVKKENELVQIVGIWSNPDKLSDEDRFLRDYIVNKRYIDEGPTEEKLGGNFSKNIEDLSDVESVDDEKPKSSATKVDKRSQEENFDKIARIPRNSTKTIRDIFEKRKKKEKRLKKLEKVKRKKKALKDADCEDILGDMQTKFHYIETEPVDYGMTAEEILMATDEESEKGQSKPVASAVETEDSQKEKKKKKRKRGLNHKKFAKTGVAPDRLLAYGLSKRKLKKASLI